MEKVIGALGLVPGAGAWITDRWLLMTGRQMKVYCRPDTSYFLRDLEHCTGLLVLDLVVENQLGTQMWVRDFRQDVLVDQVWVPCERWSGETYAASWGTGYEICKAEDRIDTRIGKQLSIEGKGSAWGYTICRIGHTIPDSVSLSCMMTLTPSKGKSVVTTFEVSRYADERKRTDVKILGDIDIGLNRRYFHYHASGGETITIPRFVYEAIQTSTKKHDVQLVKHWELTDKE